MYAMAVKEKKENKTHGATYSRAQDKSGERRERSFAGYRPNTFGISRGQAPGNENATQTVRRKGMGNGLPGNLRAGIEHLSGYSMEDVNVYYNSPRPARLHSHAYTQGTDIHLAPGQEQHLPHEAWHAAQQKQGRVNTTMQMEGNVNVNDDTRLETEANVMGTKALQSTPGPNHALQPASSHPGVVQRRGFADPAKPNKTEQWEGKGVPGRAIGAKRPGTLAVLVDKFKMQLLTYISHAIASEKTNPRYYAPHIAVIITGEDWNVAVNSDVGITRQRVELKKDAAATKAHIQQCWDALNNTYGATPAHTKASFENEEAEAVYIAFRWAAKKPNVVIHENQKIIIDKNKGEKVKKVHGEMKILDRLKASALAATPISGPPLPAGATGVLPPGYQRVVRVGGTKTPCLDCAWEMNKFDYTQDEINEGTQTPPTGGRETHDATPAYSRIGSPGSGRVSTTMSEIHGPGYPTWESAEDSSRVPRVAMLEPDEHGARHLDSYKKEQEQKFTDLADAYKNTGANTKEALK